MSSVFLETTALIELTFWDKPVREKVSALIPKGARRVTSRYVIYELARGYLGNLILLHNKSFQVAGFSELQAYASASRLAPHRLGTILGTFDAFFRSDDAYPSISDQDLLARFRGHLRGKIRRGWGKVLKAAEVIINEVGCRDDIGEPRTLENGPYEHELKDERCGIRVNCGLKAYYARHRGDFERIRNGLKALSEKDEETDKRIKYIRELYRHPTLDFARRECWGACGDATIAHECPTGAVLLTKNQRHFEPILKVLGKPASYYR